MWAALVSATITYIFISLATAYYFGESVSPVISIFCYFGPHHMYVLFVFSEYQEPFYGVVLRADFSIIVTCSMPASHKVQALPSNHCLK